MGDEALIQTTRWGIKNKINKLRKAARKAAQVVKKGVGKAKEVADKTAEFIAEAKAVAKEADKIYQDNKDILPEGMRVKLDKLREEVVEQAGKVGKASDHISEKVDTAADTLTNLEEQIEQFKKEKEPKKDEESGKKDEAKEKEPKKDEESGKKDEALIQTTRWGIKNKINKLRKAARKAAQVVKKG